MVVVVAAAYRLAFAARDVTRCLCVWGVCLKKKQPQHSWKTVMFHNILVPILIKFESVWINKPFWSKKERVLFFGPIQWSQCFPNRGPLAAYMVQCKSWGTNWNSVFMERRNPMMFKMNWRILVLTNCFGCPVEFSKLASSFSKFDKWLD